jgi:hypothetical protein
MRQRPATRTCLTRALETGVRLAAVWIAASAGAGPRLDCPEPEFAFGARDETDTVTHTFVIRNTGDAPLEITRLRPACGCTVARMDAPRIPPEGEGRLSATLTLKGRSGPQRKSIRVHSNDPDNPVTTLWLTGTVHKELAFEPSALDFGRVAPDAEFARMVALTSRRPDVGITAVRPGTAGWYAVEFDPARRDAFVVRLCPPLPCGVQRDTLTVRTSHPTRPPVKLAVSVSVLGALDVVPSQLVLAGSPGTRVTRSILLRPGTVSVYTVNRVTVPDAQIVSTVRAVSPGVWRIDLAGIPVQPDLDGAAVTIHTSVESMPDIVVPIKVILR